FTDGRMRRESVFQVNGADPFAAGFDQILGAIGNLNVSFRVDGGDVTRAQPAVRGPAICRLRRAEVAAGNPRPADMQLTHGLAIPWRFAFIVNNANVHERQRASGTNADFVSFILGPLAHMRLERRADRDRRRLRHTPDLDEANALFI